MGPTQKQLFTSISPPLCKKKKNITKVYTEGTDQQSQDMANIIQNLSKILAFDKNINFTKYQLFQNLLYSWPQSGGSVHVLQDIGNIWWPVR